MKHKGTHVARTLSSGANVQMKMRRFELLTHPLCHAHAHAHTCASASDDGDLAGKIVELPEDFEH